jgi:hypothetical protein
VRTHIEVLIHTPNTHGIIYTIGKRAICLATAQCLQQAPSSWLKVHIEHKADLTHWRLSARLQQPGYDAPTRHVKPGLCMKAAWLLLVGAVLVSLPGLDSTPALEDGKQPTNHDRIINFFNSIDHDKDGHIASQEAFSYIGRSSEGAGFASEHEVHRAVDRMIANVNRDDNVTISMTELEVFLLQSSLVRPSKHEHPCNNLPLTHVAAIAGYPGGGLGEAQRRPAAVRSCVQGALPHCTDLCGPAVQPRMRLLS